MSTVPTTEIVEETVTVRQEGSRVTSENAITENGKIEKPKEESDILWVDIMQQVKLKYF